MWKGCILMKLIFVVVVLLMVVLVIVGDLVFGFDGKDKFCWEVICFYVRMIEFNLS